MSLGRMLTKPHMCHLTYYVIHVYVIKACANHAHFIKFIWGPYEVRVGLI